MEWSPPILQDFELILSIHIKREYNVKKYKIIFLISAGVLALFIGSLVALGTTQAFSPEKDIDEIKDVAESFSEFTIPKNVKVVGIGEATHGNREFQKIKRDVIEKVVKEGDGHSICFEMAVGDGTMINDAVHDPDSDLVAVMGKQSYPLYDTEEMVELLKWMRDYNMTVPYEESLMFYGVDPQGAQTAIIYLQELCKKGCELLTEAEKEKILSIKTEEKSDYAGEREFFQKLYERLSSIDDLKHKQLSMTAKVVLQNLDAPDYDTDREAFGKHRDQCMAENLKSYSDIEGDRGYSQIVITAHNAHAMRGGSSPLPSADSDTMGDRIDRLFDGSYFCIGTEFYKGDVNIHTAGTYEDNYHRADHFYCSNDPLAYQAKNFEDGTYCLDFSKVTDENSKVYKLIHSYIFNSIIGEGYSLASELGRSDRIKMVPADRYDAIIYYYEVTPIDPIDY